MIRCEPVTGTDRVLATFAVGLVEPISVVGDFNDWGPTASPLARGGDAGTASVVMDSGRRDASRYLAEDGEWSNDVLTLPPAPIGATGVGEEGRILDLSP